MPPRDRVTEVTNMRDIDDIEISDNQVAVVLHTTHCCAEHGSDTRIEAVVDNRDALREFVHGRFTRRERVRTSVQIKQVRE